MRASLTAPGARERSDEFPHRSADGWSLLFVRGGPTRRNASATGALSLIRTSDGRLFAPLARIDGGTNYYGHYS